MKKIFLILLLIFSIFMFGCSKKEPQTSLEAIKEKGYITGIVTGENVDLNKRRVAKIGLDVYEYGTKDKLETLNKICKQYNISMENILYIGDDNNDIDILKNVGISCCPNDAIDEVKRLSTIKLKTNGGHGVVREVLDFLIE